MPIKWKAFDKDWTYCGKRRFASYTNLPAGKEYTFRVRASNEDNIWSQQGASIEIYIHPPFWEMWWFKALLYVSTAMLAFLAFRIKSAVHRKQKVSLQKEVNLRTAALKEANERLKQQADTIEQMNYFLKQDNIKLEHDVKDLSQARVLQKWVSFEEFKQIYPDSETCYKFMEELKWGKEFQCKKCGNTKYSAGNSEFSRRCSKCNYIETITSGTIFEGIKFPIEKAFHLLFLIGEKENYTLKELSALTDLRSKICWSFKKRVEERTKNLKLKKNKDGLSHLIMLN